MKIIFVSLLLFISVSSYAQFPSNLAKLKPTTDYENVHVQKISEDSLSSTFVIWVKKEVKPHFHAEHDEQVYVISGIGQMKLGDKTFILKEGDFINIPKKTVHAVLVTSKEPLKVISIQSPVFDGSDRVVVGN